MTTWRAEAERGWREATDRRLMPRIHERALLAGTVAVGAAAVVVVTAQVAAAAPGLVVPAVGAVLAATLLVGSWWAWRSARQRATATAYAARDGRADARCPRCAAPLLARDASETAERSCGGCGGRLLEAAGLIVAFSTDDEMRAARWRAAAAARLPRRSAPWSLTGASWVVAAALAIGAIWTTAAQLAAPGSLRAPLGVVHETPRPTVPTEGTASAWPAEPETPPGPATRPHAPLHVGTQVLARRAPSSPWHQLAVIVRVRRGRAFVVFADGASDWVEQPGILAPELAEGDAIEVWDGARFRPAEVRDRIGAALGIDGLDAEWTSVADVRVRIDAAHTRHAGRRYAIPRGAWVEARTAGVWRPGLAVQTEGDRLRVVLSDGEVRWLHDDDVRAQTLGPGVRLYVDGQAETRIIAARIGHALAVVDDSGERGWTALARVRRR